MRDVVGTNQSFFAQRRPGSGFETIYTARGGELIHYISIANVLSADSRWSICISSGRRYGRNNAIVWGETIHENDNDIWGYGIPLVEGQRVGVRSTQSRALNFTIYGLFG